MSFVVCLPDIRAIGDPSVRLVLARTGIQGVFAEDTSATVSFDHILSRGLAAEDERDLWNLRHDIVHSSSSVHRSDEEVFHSAQLHERIYADLLSANPSDTVALSKPRKDTAVGLWWAEDMTRALESLLRRTRPPLASPYHWRAEPRQEFAAVAARFLCRIHPPDTMYRARSGERHVLPPGKRSLPAISRIPDGRVQLLLYLNLLENLIRLWKPEWFPGNTQPDVGALLDANLSAINWLHEPQHILSALGFRNKLIYEKLPVPDNREGEKRVETLRVCCEEIAFRVGGPVLEAVVFDPQADQWPEVSEGPWIDPAIRTLEVVRSQLQEWRHLRQRSLIRNPLVRFFQSFNGFLAEGDAFVDASLPHVDRLIADRLDSLPATVRPWLNTPMGKA